MNKIVDMIAMVLVIVGGINWGLVGLLNFNLVTTLFGVGAVTNTVYSLVGIAAVYMIFYMVRGCGACAKNM